MENKNADLVGNVVISVSHIKATLHWGQGLFKLLASNGINNCEFHLWLKCVQPFWG